MRATNPAPVGEATTGRAGDAAVTRRSESFVPLALASLLFFISGVPALVYQMAWQRILALHSGVGLYSVAMIVALFMAGLGIGSHLGGVLSRRLDERDALRLFGFIELGIGLFGAVSAPLYYDLLYLRTAWLYDATWSAGLGHFVLLVVPTCLMGMSLPVLVRAMVNRVESAGRVIGYLYGVNVLGAAVGAAVTPWLLMRYFGIRGAILIGVALNLFVGMSVWLLSRNRSRATAPVAPVVPEPAATRSSTAPRHPFGLWLTLYALCGFTGLALEMVWFRLSDVAAKSTAFTFGTVLAVYLLGLGFGSLTGTWLLRRVRRPLRAFLVCQCLIQLFAAAGLLSLAYLPTDFPGVEWLMRYWRDYEGVVAWRPGDRLKLLVFYFVFPAAMFGLPTLLMGMSFCILQRAVQDDQRTSGFKVGVLQAANIAGCVAGSLVVGLWLLTSIGTTGTMRVLTACGLVFVLVGIRYYGVASVFLPLGILLAVFSAAMPGQESLWLRLHGMSADARTGAMVDEDATGLVAITPEMNGALRLSVDGKGHSWVPYGSIHSYLGALPAVVHPQPRHIAIIGLGSGDTAWAAGCRPETERVAVFELCAPERRLLERLGASGYLPQVQQFLEDPRMQISIADGRNALARSSERFDVIEADASRSQTAYSGNLYSVEFFELCRSRLRSGGIMCAWSPTPRVYATFCRVFPQVVDVHDGEILLGSNEPLPVDLVQWESRIESPAVLAYLGRHVAEGLREFARTSRPADPTRYNELKSNRDLFPRDEFQKPGQ